MCSMFIQGSDLILQCKKWRGQHRHTEDVVFVVVKAGVGRWLAAQVNCECASKATMAIGKKGKGTCMCGCQMRMSQMLAIGTEAKTVSTFCHMM